MTFLIYLNSEVEGGETRFFNTADATTPNKDVKDFVPLYSIVPGSKEVKVDLMQRQENV